MSRRRSHQSGSGTSSAGEVVLYGRHAVTAALENHRRSCTVLYATPDVLEGLGDLPTRHPGLAVEPVDGRRLRAMIASDAPHQGMVLKARPLPAARLEDLSGGRGPSLIVALDRVTDPQNVGSIMRSAAAFGAAGVLTTVRNAAGESGALAKAASGALDRLPWVRVPNLARALVTLANAGYWRIGLDGRANDVFGETDLGNRLVLVLGAEGSGLRPNTRKHCDLVARIPIRETVESLNVATAAAIAIYALQRGPS